MNAIEQELLKITAAALFEKEYDVHSNIDYATVLEEASAQSVFGLVYPLVSSALPEQKAAKYEERFFTQVLQNTMVESGHAAVHELMASNQIPYVTIKGCISAKYYPDPSLRCMGDVDFLVKKSDFDRAVELTEKQGFVPEEEESSVRHRSLKKGTVVWEVHHTVSGIPEGMIGAICRRKLDGIIKSAVRYETESGVFMVPDDFYHGLVMLLHVAGHVTSTGVGLRHVCDWAVFVNSMSENALIEMFRKDFKEIGLWYFAKVLTALCTKYLGLPKREFTSDVDDKLLADMMDDILTGGNFGKKDKDRYHSSMLVSSDNSNMLKNGLRTLNKRAKVRMPITEKVPVLLPIGWAYVGVNHLVMIRKGQRPAIHPKRTLEKSSKRRDLNKSYKLYMIENQTEKVIKP